MSSSDQHHDLEASPPSSSVVESSTAKNVAQSDNEHQDESDVPVGTLPIPQIDRRRAALRRELSTRQIIMISIGSTIGTGLFLGTGRSLAQGGPASMLLAYGAVGFIVYVTLLLLGEMATQYPVAGSFNAYVTRFFSPSYGFALSWNYWFSNAVAVAADLIAAQLVLNYWTKRHTWVASLVFWVFLVAVNAFHVGAFGELEYWLCSLKVVSIVAFIIVGVAVNVGGNQDHEYIGARYWHIPGAPFVNGLGGFARVFVAASFAYGGIQSLGLAAGETKNPSRNIPRAVKILLFYMISILLMGLDVPYTYPGLSSQETTTSPFTIVFHIAGSNAAASFVNTVILTSTVSAGNIGLYGASRVLYGLAVTNPPQAPTMFSWATRSGVPLLALLATSSISVLCFGSSFIGSGQLWAWLQNIVGVSYQISWLSIGLASWKFRSAWVRQNRPLSEMKFRAAWTWPWGPPFVVISVAALIIIQGWSSVIPKFSAVDFVSLYVEIPIMIVMYFVWKVIKRPSSPGSAHTLRTDDALAEAPPRPNIFRRLWDILTFNDLVDGLTVDLRRDEYAETEADVADDEEREAKLRGRSRWLWRVYYAVV